MQQTVVHAGRVLAKMTVVGRPLMQAAAARSFRTFAPARMDYDEWITAKPHCHHSSLWKVFKPISSNGSLLEGDHEWVGGIVGLEKNPDVVQDVTELVKYLQQVLDTMPDSFYKKHMKESCRFKLSVLESGKTQEEMEEALDFGPLEETHAVVRGEIELIQSLGKDWFS